MFICPEISIQFNVATHSIITLLKNISHWISFQKKNRFMKFLKSTILLHHKYIAWCELLFYGFHIHYWVEMRSRHQSVLIPLMITLDWYSKKIFYQFLVRISFCPFNQFLWHFPSDTVSFMFSQAYYFIMIYELLQDFLITVTFTEYFCLSFSSCGSHHK